jgi:hypothetical protein
MRAFILFRRLDRDCDCVDCGRTLRGVSMKRDLFSAKPPHQVEQDRMAANIANLKDRQSKKQQAHMLVLSLVKMIKGK